MPTTQYAVLIKNTDIEAKVVTLHFERMCYNMGYTILGRVFIRKGRAMEDVTFTRGPARRPAPRVADPLLQWATGLQTKERRIYAGWLAEAGRIEALDEAMEQAGFSQVTIKHGSGNMVTPWAVEPANQF